MTLSKPDTTAGGGERHTRIAIYIRQYNRDARDNLWNVTATNWLPYLLGLYELAEDCAVGKETNHSELHPFLAPTYNDTRTY